MKKLITFQFMISLVVIQQSEAQVTTPNNATLIPPQFVGWDGTGPGGTKPLDIRNAWANQPINFWTAGNPGTLYGSLQSNGQWHLSDPAGPALAQLNAKLDVFGPIYCSTPLVNSPYTVLATAVPVNGNPGTAPALDGFRIEMNNNFFGPNVDAMVINKTDGNQVAGDGGIVFVNEGNNGIQNLSMDINEVGRVYVGNNGGLHNLLQNRVTIDAQLANGDATPSGLCFQQLNALTPNVANLGNMGVLAVDMNGNVIKVPGGTISAANNGTSISTVNPNTIVLGNNVGSTIGQLISDREIPLNGYNLIVTGPPDTYPGKVGFGIGAGNVGPNALRTTPITMQVNGSISLFDGNGNTSLFFGEEQFAPNSGTLGEWGIQYANPAAGNPTGTGLNFWRPFGSGGYGFGNNFLFLSDNGNVSIGATASVVPGNALTIASYPTSPQPAGLRFLNLTSASVTTPNVGNMGVLAVDPNGDVIYVPGSPFTFGGACGNINNMTTNFEIPMANNNFVWTGQGPTGNNVGIGTLNCNPNAKLEILQTNGPAFRSALLSQSSGGTDCWAGQFKAGAASAENIGVQASGAGVAGSDNYGAWLTGGGGDQAYGCKVEALGASVSNIGVFADINSTTSNINTGIAARAMGAAINYGGKFAAPGTSGLNYALYASAAITTVQSPNNPPAGSTFAGYFVGDVVRTGTDNFTSDIALKQNIDSISDAIGIIAQLQPKSFYFDTTGYPAMALSSKLQYGFIAQQVQPVLPSLVGVATQPAEYDTLNNLISPSLTYKTLNYQAFIAILAKGIQEQQREIDSLQAQINSCCSMNARTANNNSNQTDVTLSNSESVVLNQNVPNPFAEQTTITYNLPSTTRKAQMIFYDAQGKMIKVVELEGTGKGQLNVFADDLSNGIYTYALVVDGQIADTKRMVKTQ